MNTRFVTWLSIVSLIMMLIACQSSSEPDPPTLALLLSVGQLPLSWEISGSPRPMGPNTSIGFGDKDDSYISFKLKNDDYNISYHFVLYYPSVREAEVGYAKESQSGFNDNSIAIDQPWETPPELSYASTHADQFRVACTINNVAGSKQVCKMIGQYGQYVTIFHSVIRPDTLSLSQFNEIVRFIDEMMTRELKLDGITQ